MSGVYRRHRERAGSGWGVWLFAAGVLGVIGVAVLIVLLTRSKSGQLPGGLVVTPQGAVVDTSEMTEREMFEFLKSKGAKIKYAGAGFLYHERQGFEFARVEGYTHFEHHPTDEAARRAAGATPVGFHWGRWSFIPMLGESPSTRAAYEVRLALGLVPAAELEARQVAEKKRLKDEQEDSRRQAADQTRLDSLNVESLGAFIEAKGLYRASRDGVSAEADRLMNKSISLDAQADEITSRHNWPQFGPNPSKKLGDLQRQKTKSILGEK